MTLIKTSLLSAISVAVKMLTLLVLNKVLAIYIGPAGYAAIGNFQNAIQMVTTLASGAINTGVVKYTAEFYGNEAEQRLIWKNAGSLALVGSILMGVFVTLFREEMAIFFLKDKNFSPVFIFFAISLVFFVFNTLLLAILNGKKEIKKYVIANIAGSILSLIVTSIMAINFGLMGALIALVIHPSIAFFATIFLCYRAYWFKFSHLLGRFDKRSLKKLSKFTIMALTSIACIPASHIFIRNHLGISFGLEAAGYWEAMWRLSSAYLMLVTTTLSVYYLPRLSEIENAAELKKEIINAYKIIFPIVIIGGFLIYYLRDFLIEILFTPDFQPMRELFAWQIFGDTLKIGSWILSFLMVSKSLVSYFVISEILSSFLFVVFSYSFTKNFGIEGVVMAHSAVYLLYWIFCFLALKKFFIK